MVDMLKIALAFGVIVALLRFKVSLGLAMLVASGLLALTSGLGVLPATETAYRATFSTGTLNLMASLYLILCMENIMRSSGNLERLVSALKKLTGDSRVSMGALPAFIGLLPSPGGALFSAPMVQETARDSGLEPERKSFINYWYRHIWEYVLPLYPALLIASEILGRPVRDIIIAQIPLTLTAILVGLPFAFRGVPNSAQPGHAPGAARGRARAVLDLLPGLLPVLMVVALALVAHIPSSIALGIGVAAMLVHSRYGISRIASMLRESVSIDLLLMVLGVMIFKDMLGATRAVPGLTGFLQGLGLAELPVIFLVPFTVGVLTGYSPAAVAVSFPLLVGLYGSQVPPAAVRMAYAAEFGGVMFSPLHLCLVLTAQYFKANLGGIYRYFFLPQLAVILVALALYLWA